MKALLFRTLELTNGTVVDVLLLTIDNNHRTVCFEPGTLEEVDTDLSDDDLDFLLEDLDLSQPIIACLV